MGFFTEHTRHNPGGKVLLPILPGVHGEAYFSNDEKHRLWLSRKWGSTARCVAIVGLNPSVANPYVDDPTIRRCIHLAHAWGYDGLFMLNVCTYRATDRKELLKCKDPVHFENAHILRKIGARCGKVVMAYGTYPAEHPKLMAYVHSTLLDLRAVKPKLHCLVLTKDGHPKHPLYVAGTTKLIPFEGT